MLIQRSFGRPFARIGGHFICQKKRFPFASAPRMPLNIKMSHRPVPHNHPLKNAKRPVIFDKSLFPSNLKF